jgi:DNA-binding response OmpR family regulator
VDPLAVLVVRRGPQSLRGLSALEQDPRVELFVTDELTPERVAFARRVSAVIAVTESDPFDALAYIVTAGLTCPIVVAMSRRFKAECSALVAAGATTCITMPIKPSDVDALIPKIAAHAAPARMEGSLRLLLDPISRVVRYRDKVARLTLREYALLHCLSEQHGWPVPAEKLMAYVWGDSELRDSSRKILDVYIFQLRKKLGRLGLTDAISTVRGFGYTLGQSAYPSSTQN